ncbi:FAD-binding protein [Flexivirga caeni]|uniref:FAD-binding protein n=1 Tax=Flexivirga caeni TaxID=2294115 RepID=A0A3M9MLK1_9MICO|nr:FAD-binding protein [Flexivirga caeni]
MDLTDLREELAGSRLIVDPDVIEAYRRDQTLVVEPGHPVAVLVAESTQDVAAALRWADRCGIPVTPRGAGTSLAGGAAAADGGLVISLAKMTAIRELRAEDELAVVEAGVVTADLDRAAARHGLMYAPDPSSHEICTVGGNVATNAGGLRCVKYGVTRDAVLGLEVVLADGRVILTGRQTVKGVTGLDLTSLFVGSEGTLGIITAVTVRLRPRPRHPPVTVVGGFDTLRAAGDAVANIIRDGVDPSLLELLDGPTLRSIDEWKHLGLDGTEAMLIAQVDGSDADERVDEIESIFARNGSDTVAISSDEAEAAQLLEVRRLAYPAAERLGHTLVEDVGVPRSRLPQLLETIEQTGNRHSVTILTVAHAGDGNTHPTFVFEPTESGDAPPQVWAAADEIFRATLTLGGTLTGEHGVGLLKQRWLELELGADTVDVQRAIKQTLDPHKILNPGKAI